MVKPLRARSWATVSEPSVPLLQENHLASDMNMKSNEVAVFSYKYIYYYKYICSSLQEIIFTMIIASGRVSTAYTVSPIPSACLANSVLLV